MTLEKLYKAERIRNRINELTNFNDELSILTLVRAGNVSVKFNEEDIETIKKALGERISKLEKEFEEV